MQAKKKSFQIYFDNVPLLMLLPDEQLGRMFKKLAIYAAEVAEEPGLMPESAREEIEEDEQLGDGAKMAFHFLSSSVFRDTQKWWTTTNARLARTERKTEAATAESYPLPSPGEPKYGKWL